MDFSVVHSKKYMALCHTWYCVAHHFKEELENVKDSCQDIKRTNFWSRLDKEKNIKSDRDTVFLKPEKLFC